MRTRGAAAADSAAPPTRRSLQAPCCFSLAHRNKPELPSRGISRFPASTRGAAWGRRMRRVGMRRLLELGAASAAVIGETRLRFQRLYACVTAAVAPRRPRFSHCYQSRCEQAQSGGRPIVCAPSSSTAPTAAADRGQQRAQDDDRGERAVPHTQTRSCSAEEEQRWWRVARRRAHPWLQNTRPRRVAKGWFGRNRFSENYRFTSVHLHYTDSVPRHLRARHPPACMSRRYRSSVLYCR